MYIPKHAKLNPAETLFVIMDQPLVRCISKRIAKKNEQIQEFLTEQLNKWDAFLEKISKELEKEKIKWLIRIKTVQIKISSLSKNIRQKITSLQR